MDSGAEVYGTLVSDIQTDVEVTGKVIIPKTIESPYVSRNVPVKYCNYVDLKKIVGASVVWNQLIRNNNFIDTTYWSCKEGNLTVENNILSYTISALGGVAMGNRIISALTEPIVSNHKYLIRLEYKPQHEHKLAVQFYDDTKINVSLIANVFNKIYTIANCINSTSYIRYGFNSNDGNAEVNDVDQIKNPILVDLTAMFGTTIADYVYTLETAEAGTGIAWLQSYGFFTEDYYEYTENKIESVCTNGRTSKGITYPISAVELRGLFKLDNGELTVDGDEYETDGTITRKYGVVDLGTLDYWHFTTADGELFRSQNVPNLQTVGGNVLSNILCTKYVTVKQFSRHNLGIYTNIPSSNTYVFDIIDNNYTDAQTFKTAMSGVYCIYELQTREVDLTTPFNERQKVGSTEQFDDYGVITGTRDVSIPVGNETDYLQNFAGQITGTLHYIEDGLAPSGYLSGSGNFIALHLDSDDWSIYTSVKVGLDPSQASGMVEILQDEDKIVVGKITNNEQVFIVESTDGEFTKTDVYSLSDLVLETE